MIGDREIVDPLLQKFLNESHRNYDLALLDADEMIEVPGSGKLVHGSQKRVLYLANRQLNLQIFRLSLQKLAECEIDFAALIYAFDDFSTINEVSFDPAIAKRQKPVVHVFRNDIRPVDPLEAILMSQNAGAAAFHSIDMAEAMDGDAINQIFFSAVRTHVLKKMSLSDSNCEFVNAELNVFPSYCLTYENKVEKLLLHNNKMTHISCPQLIMIQYQPTFTQITSIDLSGNKLFNISGLLSKFVNLQMLNLSHNELTAIPSSFADLRNLRKLLLHDNKLETLPPLLGNCRELRVLECHNNPFKTIPDELIPGPGDAACTERLLDYLRDLGDEEGKQLSRVKVMFVGDAAVGKTSLVHYMANGTFKPKDYSVATDGIDLTAIKCDAKDDKGTDTQVYLDCWDFAGQDLYYTTHQFFLSVRAIYVVMFNLAAPNENNVHYWLKSIRMMSPGAPIILVGTHADQVTAEFCETYLTSLKKKMKHYKITSAFALSTAEHMKGKSNTIVKMSAISREIIQISAARNYINKKIPSTWRAFINLIKEGKKNLPPYLTLSEIENHMTLLKIPKQSHQSCLKLLHDVGIILHFKEPKLVNLVIIDPAYLVNIMKSIVSFKNQWVRKGFISVEHLRDLIKEFGAENFDPVVSFLEKFEVVYKTSDNQSGDYIVPFMLPSDNSADFARYQEEDFLYTNRINQQGAAQLSPRVMLTRNQREISSSSGPVLNSSSSPDLNLNHLKRAHSNSSSSTATAMAGSAGSSEQSKDGKDGRSTPSTTSLPEQKTNSWKKITPQIVEEIKHRRFDKKIINFQWTSFMSQRNLQEYHRRYIFRFLPLGFFQRVIARLLCLEEVYVIDVSSSGILYTDGVQACALRDHVNPQDQNVLDVLVRSPPSNPKNFLVEIVEIINSMLSVFYSNQQDSVKVMVPFVRINPQTSKVSSRTDMVYDDVIKAFLQGELVFVAEDSAVDVSDFMPDVAALRSLAVAQKDIEVLGALGEGAFGTVYKGTYCGTLVAIKELHFGGASEQIKKYKEFRHEINIMSKLSSPYLVKLFGTSLQPLGMVMEFCPHKSLDVHLLAPTGYNWDWSLRLKVAHDVARGLAALHAHSPPIIHRDLRSPNIFICSLEAGDDVAAKIGDFGLSQHALPHLTEMLSTWQWLAPEVFDSASQKYDEKSDIYSYGVVCTEIATGILPFSDNMKFIEREVVDLSSLTSEQLSDGIMTQYENEGYVRTGSQAVKEVFKVQSIKKEIIENNLRPTIAPETPLFLSSLIQRTWVREPEKRPLAKEICAYMARNVKAYARDANGEEGQSDLSRANSTHSTPSQSSPRGDVGDTADESDLGSLGSLECASIDFRDPFQFAGFLKRQMSSSVEEFYTMHIVGFTLKTNGVLQKGKSAFLKILSQGDEAIKSVKKKVTGDDILQWGSSDVTCQLDKITQTSNVTVQVLVGSLTFAKVLTFCWLPCRVIASGLEKTAKGGSERTSVSALESQPGKEIELELDFTIKKREAKGAK